MVSTLFAATKGSDRHFGADKPETRTKLLTLCWWWCVFAFVWWPSAETETSFKWTATRRKTKKTNKDNEQLDRDCESREIWLVACQFWKLSLKEEEDQRVILPTEPHKSLGADSLAHYPAVHFSSWIDDERRLLFCGEAICWPVIWSSFGCLELRIKVIGMGWMSWRQDLTRIEKDFSLRGFIGPLLMGSIQWKTRNCDLKMTLAIWFNVAAADCEGFGLCRGI